jgi:hypothetical protein
MCLNLLPECFAEADDVRVRTGWVTVAVGTGIAPKAEAIEEVESSVIPRTVPGDPALVGTEEDGTGVTVVAAFNGPTEVEFVSQSTSSGSSCLFRTTERQLRLVVAEWTNLLRRLPLRSLDESKSLQYASAGEFAKMFVDIQRKARSGQHEAEFPCSRTVQPCCRVNQSPPAMVFPPRLMPGAARDAAYEYTSNQESNPLPSAFTSSAIAVRLAARVDPSRGSDAYGPTNRS